MKNKIRNRIIIILIVILLIAGISIVVTKGFHFDLRFQNAKRVEVFLGKDFDVKEMEQLAKEAIPNQSILIQKVEVYQDTASIIAKEITEEQKIEVIRKVNEKYGTDLTADSTAIETIPQTRGRDIIKPYMIPFMIATVIILLYMAIRYYRLGMFKIIFKTVGILALTQALLFSIIAITRIPVGRLTIPMVIIIYLLTLLGLTTKYEK